MLVELPEPPQLRLETIVCCELWRFSVIFVCLFYFPEHIVVSGLHCVKAFDFKNSFDSEKKIIK